VIDRDPRTLAHADGPATSHEAAVANAVGKMLHRERLLVVFDAHMALTTWHAWAFYPALGMDLTEVRRRATDLLKLGLLKRTGQTYELPTGRRAEMLEITELGREAVATMKEKP
jgi:hypothetical protein